MSRVRPEPDAPHSGQLCLAAALEYVSAGLALLPLAPGGKAPLAELLPKDQCGRAVWKPLALRPVSAAEVQEWFAKEPECNIGIITGQASGGLVVADFDAPPPGNWPRPITPSVITGRGEHLYYRSEQRVGCHYLLGPDGRHVGEVKGEGGYVVAPPSRHGSGRRYNWKAGLSPTELNWSFAAAPAWTSPSMKAPLQAGASEASMNTGEASMSEASMNTRIHTCFTSGEFPGLKELYRNPEVTRAVTAKLGIPRAAVERVGQKFCCVIAGHEESRPSAALFRQDDGHLLYHDFHRRSGREWFTLAEVYASRFYGRAVKLNRPEQATWQLRLLVDAGVLSAAAVPVVELPPEVSDTARRVYQGFRLLLGCKWLHTPQTPTVFSWRFAAAWCQASERLIGEAMQYLLGRGYLLPAGKQPCRGRELALFLPGTVGDVALHEVRRIFPGAQEIPVHEKRARKNLNP